MTKNQKLYARTPASTCEDFIASLSPKEKLEFEKEYRDLVISELILAISQRDDVSVRKLAKLAGISPTVVEAMRSGLATPPHSPAHPQQNS